MDIRKLIVVPVAIGALTIGIAACGSTSSSSGTTSSGSQPASTPAAQPANDGKATMAEFNQLQAGMTLQDVQKVIGSPGKLQSSSAAGGMQVDMYQWDGDKFGSQVMVQFQDGKVFTKSQFGLQ
jgi:hypothetical protein